MFQLCLKRDDKDTELAKSHLAGYSKGNLSWKGSLSFIFLLYPIHTSFFFYRSARNFP